MTRREEIEKAANEFYKGDEVSTFVVAAQWADKTMIDKACEWLDQNVVKYESGTKMGYIPFSFIEDMINDFRKAMEE